MALDEIKVIANFSMGDIMTVCTRFCGNPISCCQDMLLIIRDVNLIVLLEHGYPN